MKKLAKRQVDAMFRQDVMPAIRADEKARGGRKDIPMRCEEYNNFVDYLVSDGQLPDSKPATMLSQLT